MDSSLIDQISEDISYSGRLRVRNFEDMASPTIEEQNLPSHNSMMTNIDIDKPVFRNITTTEDDRDVDVQAKYFCHEKFSSDDIRDRHMSDVHHRCGFCLKWMKEKSSLFYHINSYSSNKEPFNCKFCEGKFISEYRLNCHLRSEHQTSIIPGSKRFEINQDDKVATFHYEVL